MLRLEVSKADRLVLTVADDGRAFAAPAGEHPHHGLTSLRRAMREQGGALRVSRTSSGTRVTAGIPLERNGK